METFYTILGIYFAIVFIHGYYRVGLEIGCENGIKEANSKMMVMRIGDKYLFAPQTTIEALEKSIDELPKMELLYPSFLYGGLAVDRPRFIGNVCS
jgi:hypothetical protein